VERLGNLVFMSRMNRTTAEKRLERSFEVRGEIGLDVVDLVQSVYPGLFAFWPLIRTITLAGFASAIKGV
jgi:hypothetical protein